MYLSEFQNNIKILLNERLIPKQELVSRKKNSKISKKIWEVIFELDPKKIGNNLSEYSEWLVRIFKFDYQYDERRFIEDAYKFQEAFSKFKGDLFQYKTLNDLLDVIEEEPVVSKRQEKLEKKNEGVKKFLYSDDNWLILIPSEAGCFYAKGTRWCTTQDRMFKEYSKEGPLFIVINKKIKDSKGRNKKYQFHFESDSFMDENDREVEHTKLGIPNKVWKIIDKEDPNIKLDSKGNLTYKKKYYDNGNIEAEHWFLNGERHRKDGPASIGYHKNGNVECEHWYLNEKYHREDGPAIIYYYDNGDFRYERWYLNGKLNRKDGPAVIDYYENGDVRYEGWYLNGKEIEPRK